MSADDETCVYLCKNGLWSVERICASRYDLLNREIGTMDYYYALSYAHSIDRSEYGVTTLREFY